MSRVVTSWDWIEEMKWLLQGDNQGRLSGANKGIGKQQEAKERKTEEQNEWNHEW